jgi:hypothetical protein
MAKKTIVELTDDLDGSSAAETLVFGLDGANFEIDLSEANAIRLRDALADFVGAARRVKNTTKGSPAWAVTRTQVRPGGNATQNRAIRSWARGNGLEIADRGRVPEEIIRKYELAHA